MTDDAVVTTACPECANGKHENCTSWAIDEVTDLVVDCTCMKNDHREEQP